MILLSVEQVTKHFGPDPVLEGVTFDMRPGERIALVGPNGAGKTTLMKILAGNEEPDSGRVVQHSSARLAYLEQQPNFAPGRTVWDEARSALAELWALAEDAERTAHDLASAAPEDRARLANRYDFLQHELLRRNAYHLDHRIERVLQGLGLGQFDMTVECLSGGQQNRLLLAKLLLAETEIILLDEPSNHLDIEATQWLESYLVESPQAMLLVSHDRYFLDRVTNRTLELYQGTVDSYKGNFTAYWSQKEERVKVQRRTYEKQQEQIAKTEDFIRRNAYGQKHAQAKDREKKLERIERVLPPREIAAPLMGFPAASRTGDLVIRADKLAKSFDRPLFANLSFDIVRGQRWGVLGPNGTGKTTLLRCLVGEEPLTAGQVTLGAGVKIGYYDQLLSGLSDESLVLDAVRPPHKEFVDQQRRDLLARFGIKGDMVHQNVGSLSGGERSRVAMARLSALDANVLILDEPTNHLDLWARDALERAIQLFDGTVLFVGHDRYFLNRVADHLLVVEPGRFRVLEGNYETYLHFVKEGLAREATSAATAMPEVAKEKEEALSPNEKKEAPPLRKRRFPFRKTSDLEREILERETRVEELQFLLVSPDVYSDGRKVKEVQTELSELKSALQLLYAHWEEAVEFNPK